jgi:methylase of polypeptide subunit release factors
VTVDDAPRTDDREGISQLRAALEVAGFTAEAVNELLGLDDLLDWNAVDVPFYARLLPPATALSTLVELLVLGRRVDRAAAGRALAPAPLERLERMGLLRLVDGGAEPAFEIVPTGDFLLASDRRTRGPGRPDHVLGFVAPTRVLATLTVVEPVENALDVGTGSGYQALHAATVADRVVGVDVNARALQFSQFNAALNGLENVELREGSLFEPVAGERFGLIVCNPPYVISPETDYVFRDSGLPGDSFCEALVRQLPDALAEGGHGVALIAWVHRRDEDPSAPVRRWVEGRGCDALLLRYSSTDPLEYAAGWNRTQTRTPDSFAAALERWTAYYDELGIEAIAWGGLVLRRRSAGAPNWFWHHRPSSRRIGSASEQILRLFAAQDFLRGNGDGPDLLGARLALAGDHVFEQTGRLDDDASGGEPTVLRLDGGLCFRMEVDGPTIALLSRLDGRRTLGEAVAELAAASRGVEPARLAEASLPGIRRLVELGFLVARGVA